MEHAVNGSDPRVKRTRQLLMQAFTELAAEKDIRAITVQDIAARATLNRATFYAHFRDKEALLDAAFRDRTREMLGVVQNALLLDALRVIVKESCDRASQRHCRTGRSGRFKGGAQPDQVAHQDEQAERY